MVLTRYVPLSEDQMACLVETCKELNYSNVPEDAQDALACIEQYKIYKQTAVKNGDYITVVELRDILHKLDLNAGSADLLTKAIRADRDEIESVITKILNY